MKRMRTHWWNGIAGWLDIRGRGFDMIAFVLNRITGLALVAYLVLHLIILSLLAAGPAAWNLFVTIAKSPLFLGFDLLLLAGLLIHGLNGIRLILVGFSTGLRYQRTMFIVAMAAGAALLLAAAARLFGGG
jgi:succinate dehydrogenase / fumarate reductase, cytochrome b subunit